VDDKELADAIVALGVGSLLPARNKHGCHVRSYPWYEINDDEFVSGSTNKSATVFVRDWRVAGAMMEKLESYDGFLLRQSGDDTGMCRVEVAGGVGVNGNMCRAICEACVEALK